MWKHCFLLLIGLGNWYLSYCQVSFTEESVESGILHSHVHLFQIGGGVAIVDFDNDGWEDAYFTGGEESDKLYKNLGTGQFQDVSVAAGIAAFSEVETSGVTTGDIDNDGFLDFYVGTGAPDFSTIIPNRISAQMYYILNGTSTCGPPEIREMAKL